MIHEEDFDRKTKLFIYCRISTHSFILIWFGLIKAYLLALFHGTPWDVGITFVRNHNPIYHEAVFICSKQHCYNKKEKCTRWSTYLIKPSIWLPPNFLFEKSSALYDLPNSWKVICRKRSITNYLSQIFSLLLQIARWSNSLIAKLL